MHALGIVLIWTALQVTVICLVILIVLRFARNSEPLWRGKVILAGIVSSLVVSAFALSPWPSWPGYWSGESNPPASGDSVSEELVQTSYSALSNSSAGGASAADSLSSTTADTELVSPWSEALTAFLEQVRTPTALPRPTSEPTAKADAPFSTASWIAFLVLCGVGYGFVRLMAGIWLLREEVARSPILEDDRVRAAIQSIAPCSSPKRPIEVRVTARLQSAATTGIVRPILLLPVSWEEWTDEELHAVLAHELNHIQRKDCLMALCAELARVLHFYHPLMHWLANRLRLEQEWAADAQAAQSLGGRKRYLCILAEMALNETSRAPAWPVRAFLPSHRTFMRRIEMLKNNHAPHGRASRLSRGLAFAAIGLATVFALGLRNQGQTASAQDPKPSQAADSATQAETLSGTWAENAPFALTYAPDDAIGVFGIRPKALLSQPALKPLVQLILQNEQMAKPFGVPIDQFEQVVYSLGTGDNSPPQPMLIAAMIRISGKFDLETLKEELAPESTTGFYGGQLYLKNANGVGPAFWLADERTLIFSDSEAGLKKAIDARNLSVGREKRIPVWESAAKQSVAGYFNVAQLRKLMEGGPEGFVRDSLTPQEAFQKHMALSPFFGPLVNVDTVVGGVDFGREIDLKLTAYSKDAETAMKVQETLNAMLVLGRNMIEQNQQMIGQLPQEEQKIVGSMMSISQEVLKTLKISRETTNVVAQAKLPENSVNLITLALFPAVTNAREAAQRAQSMNNLKQIGLAMHNYHDTHNQFPAPVMMGPDGKTPHSWRVAILPFIDQAELYNQYKFDEPWDSEHNKKLAEQIPPVYRHPMDKQDSKSASYFALVGANTLMGDNKRGTRMADIVDGTSNTLLIVEAKRDIPWSKPEDIAYSEDRAKAPPELGGWFKQGFLTVMGDGAARMISKAVAKNTLQNLIERNDGQPINHEELFDQSRRTRTGGATAVPTTPRPTDRVPIRERGEASGGASAGSRLAPPARSVPDNPNFLHQEIAN